MISLSSLKPPSIERPLIFTVVAEGGLGKTSLAALFPRPVFIRTEDGTQSIAGRQDVALFPLANTSGEILEAVASLGKEDHPFKTLVVDSITKLNVLIEAEVLAMDPKAKGLNQALGGYGNAYDAVSKAHLEIASACRWLSEAKGMNIVFIAHASTETVDPPDDEPYTRYSIPLHKKSLPHYTNDVDVVAYIKQKFYTVGADGKKKKAIAKGDERIITCYPTPSHVSKNRLGIKEDLPFVEGVNPFAQYLMKLEE